MIKNCVMSEDLIAIVNVMRLARDLLQGVADKYDKDNDAAFRERTNELLSNTKDTLDKFINILRTLVNENGENSPAFTLVPVSFDDYMQYMLSELLGDVEYEDTDSVDGGDN